MPSTSAEPRPYARRPASRSKTLLLISLTGPKKTAMPCSASSTAICQPKEVRHETLLRKPPPCRSVGHRLSPGWITPRPGRSSAVSLACAETVLPDPLRCSRAQASCWLFDHRPPLLHGKSNVEVDLVPARLRLRQRAAGKR